MPALDIQVSKESDVPVHEQLAAQIVMLIGSGKLRPGDALPSARELAQRLRIHRNTVSQAFRDLILNLLVEKSRGRRLIVRPFQAARAASGGKLDELINAFVLEIQRRGYTLGELYRQVQARVLAAPPDHILVVSNDSGMRLLLPAELKETFKLRVDSCSVSELVSKPELTIAALVLSPPGHIAAIAGLLPPERPPLPIIYSSPDEHLKRIRSLKEPSLIALVSVSEYFLKSARAILSPVAGQRHSICEYLLAPDAGNMPGAADLILCDVVAHQTLRGRHKRAELIRHRVIASACLDEIASFLAAGPHLSTG